MELSVICGTFGDEAWVRLAEERALPSARSLGVPVIHRHADTLHEARNAALAEVATEFVAVCDADDELTENYAVEMATSSADIRACAVQYVKPNGRPCAPYVPRVAGHRHECSGPCLREGNFVAVGAVVRTELLRAVGGWEPWAVYEDWAAVLRMYLAGASVESIPTAVYKAHVRMDSRNRAPDMATKNAIHHEIVAAILPDQAAA